MLLISNRVSTLLVFQIKYLKENTILYTKISFYFIHGTVEKGLEIKKRIIIINLNIVSEISINSIILFLKKKGYLKKIS